jgi:hypothetical protein
VDSKKISGLAISGLRNKLAMPTSGFKYKERFSGGKNYISTNKYLGNLALSICSLQTQFSKDSSQKSNNMFQKNFFKTQISASSCEEHTKFEHFS